MAHLRLALPGPASVRGKVAQLMPPTAFPPRPAFAGRWLLLGRWFAVVLAAAPVDARDDGGEVTDLVLARVQRGDHRAFAEIVGRYDERLRALAYRLLGDRDRMDDALQEAYVKAFRSLPSFRG